MASSFVLGFLGSFVVWTGIQGFPVPFELERYPQKLFAFRKGMQTPTPINFGGREFPEIIYETDFEKEIKN